MNVFELTLVMSVSAGPITGGIAGRSFGLVGVVVGILVGFVVGIVCYVVVFQIIKSIATICHLMDDAPKNWAIFIPWWIASVASLMMMMLAPVGSIVVTIWLASLARALRDQL